MMPLPEPELLLLLPIEAVLAVVSGESGQEFGRQDPSRARRATVGFRATPTAQKRCLSVPVEDCSSVPSCTFAPSLVSGRLVGRAPVSRRRARRNAKREWRDERRARREKRATR